MAANVVNFPSILSIAAGAIFVRLINKNLNTAASTFALFSTFFLNFRNEIFKFMLRTMWRCTAEFHFTYGNHKQLGDAILFDGERQWNPILFNQHFAVCWISTRMQISAPICRELQSFFILIFASNMIGLFSRFAFSLFHSFHLFSQVTEVNGISFMKNTDFYCLRIIFVDWSGRSARARVVHLTNDILFKSVMKKK